MLLNFSKIKFLITIALYCPLIRSIWSSENILYVILRNLQTTQAKTQTNQHMGKNNSSCWFWKNYPSVFLGYCNKFWTNVLILNINKYEIMFFFWEFYMNKLKSMITIKSFILKRLTKLKFQKICRCTSKIKYFIILSELPHLTFYF